MNSRRKKIYIGIAIVALTLAILNIVGFLLHPSDKFGRYDGQVSAGTVITISAEEVRLMDARNVEQNYRIAPDVRVFEGREEKELDRVQVGDFVMIRVHNGMVEDVRLITAAFPNGVRRDD